MLLLLSIRKEVNRMSQAPAINVTYDGEYPCSCMGLLTIAVDGVVLYSKEYMCYSTGRVWFDENWADHVETGQLLWESGEIEYFDPSIRTAVQLAVAEELAKVHVCCGGCV
jgi:hypothetical protein